MIPWIEEKENSFTRKLTENDKDNSERVGKIKFMKMMETQSNNDEKSEKQIFLPQNFSPRDYERMEKKFWVRQN